MKKSEIIKQCIREIRNAPDHNKDSFDAGFMIGLNAGFDQGFFRGAGYTLLCMVIVAVSLWFILI